MVHHLKFLIPTAWRLRRPKFEKEIFQIRLKLSHFTILKNRFFCWYLSKFSTKLEIFNHMALYKSIFHGKNESKWLVNISLGTFVPTCQWYYYFHNFSVIWFWTYFFEKIWKFSNLHVFIFLTCQIPVKNFLVFILNILAQKKFARFLCKNRLTFIFPQNWIPLRIIWSLGWSWGNFFKNIFLVSVSIANLKISIC